MPSQIVLASGSPRRRELLSLAGLTLVVRAADVDETPHGDEEPAAYAARVAADKVRAVVAHLGDGDAVLGADTTVVLPEAPRILGKPGSPDEARAMLGRLSGRTHHVVTAYTIAYRGREHGHVVSTAVDFRPLLATEIDAYVAARDWEGKAGGYGVQGLASVFIRAIVGSYTNVVGLPLCQVLEDLAAVGALPAEWALGARGGAA